MKKLTCEMCGSNDIVKQDGMYVCQSCGTKYSVEEAKKLMVEGTVKIDTSDELTNLYQIARRAKDDNNSENAAKYYDMILVKDPTSWEASFYVVYFKAMSCKIAQIRSAAISVSNCEGSVLSLIKNNVPEDEQEAAVKEVMLRSCMIANMLSNGAIKYYDGIDYQIKENYSKECVDNVSAARDIAYICGDIIEKIFGDNETIARHAAKAWKTGIEIHSNLLSKLSSFLNVDANEEVLLSYAKKTGKYDQEYYKEYQRKPLRDKLRNEISSLEKRIKYTAENDTMTKAKSFGCGFLALLFGIIMLVGSKFIKSVIDLAALPTIFIVVGIVSILFAIAGFLSVKESPSSAAEAEADKQKRLAELTAELEKKKAELAELSK